ncbi:histidine kinase [Sphingobacterium sp. DN00404]|uniref:Histidine kinase n=1 Tax=Sphingobacterium micropteri TaxID=2763501 RepID=A0ABR7YMW8_9SPHI|nr:histidine kinase [Sphingobacterium micropteri]MBD1432667.1 histidine kinase [Sphingobacterium micropteri]
MKKIAELKVPTNVLIHLLGWVAHYWLTASRNQTSEFEGNIYLAAASFFLLYIPLFYTVWFIVGYCAVRRAWKFCFLLLLLFYPTLVSITYLMIYKMFPLYDIVFYNSEYRLTWIDLFSTLIVEYCKLLVHVFLFRLILWGIRSIAILKKQKNENSELKEQQLRFVLDGHFQYNVLSSIANQLALKGNWEFARSLGRLGSVQRYSYEKTHARLTMISLREEVNQVESLIDVLRLQYGNNDVVEYVKKGTVDGHKVPPVLLLSFMDNVLKYASVNDTGRSIKIKIDCQDDVFTFVAINKFENKRGFRRSSGIGLSSVQERLDLLAQQRYSLRYGARLGYFFVELTIKKSEHGSA